jgi:hypothetical protein
MPTTNATTRQRAMVKAPATAPKDVPAPEIMKCITLLGPLEKGWIQMPNSSIQHLLTDSVRLIREELHQHQIEVGESISLGGIGAG